MRKATYIYKYRGYDRGARVFLPAAMRVEVHDESKNCYYVKYLEPKAGENNAGSFHWVGKDKVVLDEPTPVTIHAPARDIRLPYKDND